MNTKISASYEIFFVNILKNNDQLVRRFHYVCKNNTYQIM